MIDFFCSGLSDDEAEEMEVENGKRYYRTLRLSSDKLKSLGLVWGANEVRFSITTKYQVGRLMILVIFVLFECALCGFNTRFIDSNVIV